MQHRYVIGSGWYCNYNRVWCNGGNRYSRTVEFHELWKTVLWNYSNPAAVLITSNSSPILLPPDPREQIVTLKRGNELGSLLSGWGCSFIMGAMTAFCMERDFFYVEQDCLAIGDWVDRIYWEANRFSEHFFAGSPIPGTAYQLQTDLIFVPYKLIPHVVQGFITAPYDLGHDEYQLGGCRVPCRFNPFGVGRIRPFDLSSPAVNIQHWTDGEILQVAEHLGLAEQVQQDYQHPESWRG